MNDKDYYEEIEQILRQILQPIEKISFLTFVRVVSGYKIIPINLSKKEDKDLIDDLIKVCEEVIEEIKKTNGIKDKEGKTPNRPNEVGNYIENYVKDVLNKYGYADTPKTQSGSKKSTGYPDIEFWYKGKEEGEGRIVYIEIKTFNEENINSTQRTFYASPSKDEEGIKIRYDAPHICLSFKIEKKNNNYYATGFKIIDLSKLIGRIKREFNASNKELYKKELIIYEKELN
ncbi:restriction endonuclease [Methanocaldococcus sp. 10A]